MRVADKPRWRAFFGELEIEDADAPALDAIVGPTVAGSEHDGFVVGGLSAQIHHDMGDGRIAVRFADGVRPEKKVARGELFQFPSVSCLAVEGAEGPGFPSPPIHFIRLTGSFLQAEFLQNVINGP